MTPRLLDLFCGAGGCSVGYGAAGFDVTGVDMRPMPHHRGGTFVQSDALDYVAAHGHEFDAIHASPPCQAHSVLRHVTGRQYVDLIPQTRALLQASGKPYVIENVPGAPLGGGSTYLLLLCGTMFGLVTPDGRAEIRRHRLFETNWCFGLMPECQHGGTPSLHVAGENFHLHRDRARARKAQREALTVSGHSLHGATYTKARRAMTVTGNTAQINVVRNTERETFTADEARAAMGIDWMPMKYLSQAIPPAYTEWLGRRLMLAMGWRVAA